MINNSSKTIILAASFVFFLISCLVLFASKKMNENSESLNDMTENQLFEEHLSSIRNSIVNRAFILFKIHETSSPIKREKYFSEFQVELHNFEIAKQALNSNNDHQDHRWHSIKTAIMENHSNQEKIANLLRNNNQSQKEALLINKFILTQSENMTGMTKLFNFDSEHSKSHYKIVNDNNSTRNILLFFGFSTIIIGTFVTRATVRAISKSEANMISQGERIRELYKISALPISIDEQIYEMLKLEAQVLDMEIGKVCKIEPEEDKNTFIHIYSIPSLNIPQGRVAKLERTFCSIAYKREEPLAIDHVKRSEFKDYICYSFSQQESYIAHQVWIKGELFGTISFSSSKPRKAPFTEVDKELIRLMANWVSVALERKMAAEETTKAKQMAEQANVAKTNFLANMSHEIRTPLTAIIGFADSLNKGNYSEEQRDQWTSSIVRNGSHLHQIINDILDLSKIEAGQLQIEKSDISPSQILTEIDSIVGSRTRDKGLTFNIVYQMPYPKTVFSDPIRLKQILINLCGNAQKFTENGSITIKSYCDKSGHQLIFEVIDTGIGMTEEQTQKIFKPFSQADSSTTRKFGGTGLGLTISRQLAEKLGGDLICQSTIGKGSNFIISINTGPLTVIDFATDLSQLSEIKRYDHQTVEYNLLKGHILLAEDNPDNQNLISLYASQFGLSIDFADNGQQAVEKAVQQKYDLILMDMQMPVMGGLESVQMLRQMGSTLPIIMLTANAMTCDKDKCLEAGAEDYVTKPINIDKFYQVLAGYLPKDESNKNATNIDNSTELNKLTNNFMNKLPSMITELNEAVDNLHWDSVQSLSHILKGMGTSFGQPEITRISAIINKDSIKQNSKAVVKDMADLKNICDSAISDFKNNQPKSG